MLLNEYYLDLGPSLSLDDLRECLKRAGLEPDPDCEGQLVGRQVRLDFWLSPAWPGRPESPDRTVGIDIRSDGDDFDFETAMNEVLRLTLILLAEVSGDAQLKTGNAEVLLDRVDGEIFIDPRWAAFWCAARRAMLGSHQARELQSWYSTRVK